MWHYSIEGNDRRNHRRTETVRGRKCEKERGASKMDSLSGVTKVMKLTVDVMCWINNGDRGETENVGETSSTTHKSRLKMNN